MERERAASIRRAGPLDRRHVMIGSAAVVTAAFLPSPSGANVPVPYDWNAAPPMDARASFIDWMSKNRGENPGFLGQRWDRFQQLLAQRHILDERDKRAFLLTPREEFVTSANLHRAYEDHYLPIGFGVTITDPQTVARMTNSISVKLGDKVLEVGTGSGYQCAYLSNLTDEVWSIEIIKPLAQRTLRFTHRARLQRVQGDHDQACRRLLWLGRGSSFVPFNKLEGDVIKGAHRAN